MAVTPAGAEVSTAVATNWKKIWKKNLKPLADKRYYTKAQSDTKYATKVESAAGDAAANAATDSKLGSYYTKAQADTKYSAAGSGYTKAESDAKYAPTTTLVRGNVLIVFTATAVGQFGSTDISFGSSFTTAPTVHVIAPGAPAPAGCAGSAAAPDASPGHLCIFGSLVDSVSAPNTCKVSSASCFGTASDPWGASIFTTATATGTVQYFATWAARPTGIAVPGRVAPSSAPNRAPMGSGVN